jgi:hypothetical protein
MDAAGALALRRYIEAHNSGVLRRCLRRFGGSNPSSFLQIEAYLRAFHELAEEVTPS